MQNIKFRSLVLIAAILFAVGCGTRSNTSSEKDPEISKNVASADIQNISVQEAQTAISDGDVQFLDVRMPAEFEEAHAKNAVNMPLNSVEGRLKELKKDDPVYLICRTGSRSAAAAEILKNNGFQKIYNINGGTVDWINAELPVESSINR